MTPPLSLSLTREQLEAHLLVMGWSPIAWGEAGATKGDAVVYVHAALPLVAAMAQRRGLPSPGLEVSTQWNVDFSTINSKILSHWLWSDDLFYLLARRIVDCDHSDARYFMRTPLGRRCSNCTEFVKE